MSVRTGGRSIVHLSLPGVRERGDPAEKSKMKFSSTVQHTCSTETNSPHWEKERVQ